LAAARDLLRARRDAQQTAATALFGAAALVAEPRRGLVCFEQDQAGHAAALADALGVDAAAQVTGWSRNRINQAQRSRRGDTNRGDAGHTPALPEQEVSGAIDSPAMPTTAT
jgi:hypothetical protein